MKYWIDKDEVIAGLNLKRFGAQGWMQNRSIPCPWCGRGGEKLGIKFNETGNGAVCNCYYCGTKGGIIDYLRKIGREDLLKQGYENSVNSTSLTPLKKEKEDEQTDLQVKAVPLPKKLEPLIDYPYLNERGFLKYHYEEFEPSMTDFFLEKALKNYIIFKLKMNGEVVAWLARSQYSYEWHRQNLKEAKERGIKPKLRYENSRTDFTKIIGGYDHITENTDTVFLVEGLFDKVGLDNLLDTPNDESVKCCFLFGNSISAEQIELLKLKKSVRNIILMFDDSCETQSKSAGLMLAKHFNTKIAHLTRPGIDPNDMDIDYLLEILDKLEDPINFYVNKIPKRW